MQRCRRWVSRQYWLIGLLFSSLLVMLLFSSHFHLHHLDETGSEDGRHAHMVDVHFLTDVGTHADPDSGSIPLKNGPDSLVKKFSDLSLDVVLLVVLLLILPLTGIKISRDRKLFTVQPPRYYSLSPPLRAPPQH